MVFTQLDDWRTFKYSPNLEKGILSRFPRQPRHRLDLKPAQPTLGLIVIPTGIIYMPSDFFWQRCLVNLRWEQAFGVAPCRITASRTRWRQIATISECYCQ